MTTATEPARTDTWTAQLEQLKVRYKHVRPAVLAALNVLLHDPNVSVDDAKAQANLHGVRITAASVNAARTLLSRMDDAPANKATSSTKPPAAPPRAPRRARVKDAPIDAEALVRGVVAKIQGQGSAEAERLRDGIRKAISVLQAAVGS